MIKLMFTLLIVFNSNLLFAGGVTVGNGGDSILCSNADSYKSLDYILTKKLSNDQISLVVDNDLTTSLNRIYTALDSKKIPLADSFYQFIKSYKKTNPDGKYIWKKSYYNLIDVLDEKINQIPYSCKNSFGQVDIKQTIIRSVNLKTQQIVFEYDSDLITYYENNDPYQLSFILVHEWLWSYCDSIEKIRHINHLLHSNLLEKLSDHDLKEKLIELGLRI